MPTRLAKLVSLAGALAIAFCALLVCDQPRAWAQEPTDATLAASFSPDRVGARGALTLTLDFSGGELGVPSPVRKALVRLPAGLGLDVPSLRSCSVERLRALGTRGCPQQSRLGSGHALVEGLAGSQLITEKIGLSLFIGPLQSFQPTFDALGQGYTPLEKRIVLTGTVEPSHPPYGEELVMSVPPIPTLPLEADASLAELTLTVGSASHRLARDANTVVVPGRCPAGGFPFAAELTYADGSTGDILATAPCPRQRKRVSPMRHRNRHLARLATGLAASAASAGAIMAVAPFDAAGAAGAAAHTARAISVNEQGRLHLISKHGFTLNEQGAASGTIKGPISVQLKIVSSSRVTAEVTISPSGGSISGYGTASYHRGETSASFSGSLAIKHGSGSYDHAQGSALSFSGTIARSNEAIDVRLSGSLSE